MTFRAATAVSSAGDGTYRARIGDGWDIGGNANGGYLLAMVGRAVTHATAKPHPVTMTAHYLAPGKVGDVAIDVDVVRIGGRHATATATMRADDDKPLLAVVATTTDLTDAGGALLVDAAPPELPEPDECMGMDPTRGAAPGLMGNVDLRLHPEDAGFVRGEASGRARVRGWFRLRDDEPVDPIGLLLAVDVFPPTVFNARLPVAWTPTVELTAHVRGVPAPGWLRCAFTTRFVTGGYLEEDGEVWDADGRLIAQSRQLALVPRG